MSKPYYETEEYSEAENELDTYDDKVKLVMEYRISEKQKDKQIADLQHKLEVAEKALELACNEELRSFGEYDEDYGYEKQFQMLKDQYKEQAEKEVKGEHYV